MNRGVDGIGMTSSRTRERLIRRLRDQGIDDENVLAAIARTPRHLFIDEALATRAYEDTALPIGCGQTISQPYVVARMTQAVCAGRRLKNVLEIGTGCGYQTAVLAEVVDEVYTVERMGPLYREAHRRLSRLGYRNVRLRLGDGSLGWAEHAPYDGIVVTAAAADVPRALLEQLAPGAHLIIPVGGPQAQELLHITRIDDGWSRERLESVNFVPLVQDRP